MSSVNVYIYNLCPTYYRFLVNCGPQNPWTQDHLKAHVICPSYTDTALLKKDAEKASIEEIERVTKFKVMTPTKIGNTLDQVLDADENGSDWVVMHNLQIFQYPELNGTFLIPMILFVKFLSLFRPGLKRINGRYRAIGMLMISFLIFYTTLIMVF